MEVEVIFGDAEADLFDGPGVGHVTYRGDNRWLTSVDASESGIFCSHTCAAEHLITNGFTPAEDHYATTIYWRRDGEGRYSDATIVGSPDLSADTYAEGADCEECGVVIVGRWDYEDHEWPDDETYEDKVLAIRDDEAQVEGDWR